MRSLRPDRKEVGVRVANDMLVSGTHLMTSR